jgi:hypothetical protein
MLFYNKEIFERCFCYRAKYWYKNTANIPRYFKLMHHLIKHGYDEYATWETFNWFIDTMKSILISYRKNRCGTPIVVDNYPGQIKSDEDKEIVRANDEKWNGIIDRMIELLDLMDECNPKYDDMDYFTSDKEINAAKDEFFKLFAEHFYRLWD